VLFNTLMDGMPDIEEGLVQKESPYAGTKQFGMCYVDGNSGKMAT
jgi:ATP-dependent Lon protease